MPQHKITYAFAPALATGLTTPSTVGSLAGWTETFYDLGDRTDAVALSTALGFFQSSRRAMLSTGWRCYVIRASRFPLSRTGAKLSVSPQDGVGTYSAQISALIPDLPAPNVLVINFTSLTGKIRSWGMRGIEPGVVGANGLYLAPARFANAFAQFATQIAITPPYGLRILTKAVPFLITGVVTAPSVGNPAASPATPVLILNTINAIPGPPFGSARITGAQGIAGLNGTWTIASSYVTGGAGVVQLAPKRRALVTGVYTQGGTFTQLTYSLDGIALATPGQGGSHRLGRAPFAPRGRRSRRQL